MRDEIARSALKQLINNLEREGVLSPKRAKEIIEILQD